MTPSDWIKLMIILPVFFLGGPALGMAMKDKAAWQRAAFALMCFMTINGLFKAGNWGLTLASVETYRGHAKGYHFYFNHIFAIALIVAKWRGGGKDFRWLPPGILFYALYIGCSLLSVVNAPRVDYVMMAAHKMIFFSVIFVAAFNYLRTAEDLQFFVRVMAFTMVWQAVMVLKMKYLEGIYQVRGTFEHQNPLAMYSVFIGMPFLAVAMGPKFKGQGLCFAGFIATGIIVQSALSRAALLMFAAGAVGVTCASLLEKPTKRRFGLLAGMSVLGGLGLLLTLDTIISRFNDKGNDASSELREVLNEASRQMVQAHPLGIGWNHYALCINTPYPYAEVVYDWIRGRGMKVNTDSPNAPVESHYYLLLGETGYLGLGSYLLMIGVGLWRCFLGFVMFRHSFERCLCLGVLSGSALNYIQSTLERVLTQPRNLMLWLIVFGVVGRLHMLRKEERKARKAAKAGLLPEGTGKADAASGSADEKPDRKTPPPRPRNLRPGLPWPAIPWPSPAPSAPEAPRPASRAPGWPVPPWAQDVSCWNPRASRPA